MPKKRKELDKQKSILSNLNTHDSQFDAGFHAADRLRMFLDGPAAALEQCRTLFDKEFKKWVAGEKDACAAAAVPCQLDDKVIQQVYDLLAQCRTLYDVEALGRFVFDECVVPDNFKQVTERAFELNVSTPVYEVYSDKKKGFR